MATVTQNTVTAAAGDVWTLAYTAAGTVTLTMQNRSPGGDLLIRVGAATATSDAAGAGAESLYPRESRAIPLSSGDKVHVRPVGEDDILVSMRVA